MSKSNGAQVSIIGHNEDRLKRVARELDVDGSFLDARDVKELNKYFQKHGNFDHVISTLGGAMGGGFLDSSYQLIERTIQEKFFANLKVARVASKYLNKGGSLIFTSGSGGILMMPLEQLWVIRQLILWSLD
jgi:Enoyl-[acyl-carrier-protein] reductase (NADH)